MNHKIKFLICSFSLILLFATIATAKQSPIADAGNNLYLNSKEEVRLQGAGTDSDNQKLEYFWNCTGGDLSNQYIENPVYTAPIIIGFNNKNIFNCTLTVKDEDGLTNSDTIKIYVNYKDKEDITDIDVKTKIATNLYSNKATLNGSFITINNNAKYGWFEYGFSKNYGTKTDKQPVSQNSDDFSENIDQLFLNGEYHYRAVVEDSKGNAFYGQDIIFNVGSNYQQDENFTVSKKIINLSSGQFVWSKSVNAKPNDILCISATIQAQENLYNSVIKEILPPNLIYSGNLLINATINNTENPINGINLGDISKGDIIIISYQVKVSAIGLGYGTTSIKTQTILYNNESTLNQNTSEAWVIIYNSQVYGTNTFNQINGENPSSIATGLTNNLLTDSFLLPLLIIIFSGWFYFSGKAYKFADWIKTKL